MKNILKTFDENSIENLNFYFILNFIFENLLEKIEASERAPFFYNNSFGLRGNIPPSPAGAHVPISFLNALRRATF